MPRTQSRTAMLIMALAVAGLTGCGGDSGVSPSDLPPQNMQFNSAIPPFSVGAIPIPIDRQGRIFVTLDWNFYINDLDLEFFRGTCTSIQYETVAGCRQEDAIGYDRSLNRPAVLDVPVTPGDHTLMVLHHGPVDDVYAVWITLN